MDSCFAQLHLWILQIHALGPTYACWHSNCFWWASAHIAYVLADVLWIPTVLGGIITALKVWMHIHCLKANSKHQYKKEDSPLCFSRKVDTIFQEHLFKTTMSCPIPLLMIIKKGGDCYMIDTRGASSCLTLNCLRVQYDYKVV